MTDLTARRDISRRRFAGTLLLIVVLAALLRGLFPTADPPWRATVGVVWHDEGAWVHNARNRALFGTWRLDEWNPMYVAPVFTGLEFLSFHTLGVGLRQARLVSEIGGLLSVVLLGLAMARTGGRRAGLIAAALLATNYVYVMWNRAALLETTMVVFVVAAFYCYVRALEQPRWGLLAGGCAWLAFFSKAAAAFFLPTLGAVALLPLVLQRLAPRDMRPEGREVRAGYYTIAGLTLGAIVGLVGFIGPQWQQYWFYNWQMSVTRKPSYTIKALADRLSWFPILHDSFTRMWLILVVSATVVLSSALRLRSMPAAQKLLVGWIAIGVLELLVHDVGNERRFLFLVPAMCGLAALVLAGEEPLLPPELARLSRSSALLAAPAVLYASYVVIGPLARLPFLYQVQPSVRWSAALAVAASGLAYAAWPRLSRASKRTRLVPGQALVVVLLVVGGDLAQFTQWAAGRTYRNYEAARKVGRELPPGTLVQGKLANGLSLESTIRPVFVGTGFGNYEDRTHRPDIRYVLTYISPRVGFEGPVIRDVLGASPHRRVLWTVSVAENTCGCDAAALVVKEPGSDEQRRPFLSLASSERPEDAQPPED